MCNHFMSLKTYIHTLMKIQLIAKEMSTIISGEIALVDLFNTRLLQTFNL